MGKSDNAMVEMLSPFYLFTGKELNKSTVSKIVMFSNWVTEQIMRKILSYLEGLR